MYRFTHFIRRIFETEKQTPQIFALLECMHQPHSKSTTTVGYHRHGSVVVVLGLVPSIARQMTAIPSGVSLSRVGYNLFGLSSSLSAAEVKNMKYYQKQCWPAGRSQVFDTLSRTDGVLLSPAPGASSSSSVVSAKYYFIGQEYYHL